MSKAGAAIEEELIFGAIDRERRWRRIAYISATFGITGCLLTGIIAVSVDKPAPVLVPFDVRTGIVQPDVKVGSISKSQKDMVMESLIYSYVSDRETYNSFDNDLRIEAVKARSTDGALKSLIELWDSSSQHYLPRQYAGKSQIDVAISSITLLSEHRAQVRLRKRLTSMDGNSDGSFLVTLEYALTPTEHSSLDVGWKNPFGFSVKNYRVVTQQYEQG